MPEDQNIGKGLSPNMIEEWIFALKLLKKFAKTKNKI